MATDHKARLRELLAPGRLFEGKYRIEGALGSGNFAHVLRARHEVMDRDVALKVLKPELVRARPDVTDRFLNEVRIVSKLRHPNTVTVFDFGTTDDDISYMVMEYVEGESLEDLLETEGALEPRRAVHITKQILKSLDEAHSVGIIHRDLKPSNIMLTRLHGETDFVKVLDFGVAKLVDQTTAAAKRNQFERRSTQFVGTPIYMSPEQVLGDTVVAASDLYSLGLILYEMLTGRTPVEAGNVAAVAQIHIDDAPIPFTAIDTLTARFQKLIHKATARRVEDRFQDVRGFARQLPEIGGAEHSAEFAGLFLDEQGAPAERKASGLDDISENTWDVFSGKNYIAPPEESDERRPRERRRAPMAAQPVRLEQEAQPGPKPRADLALDVGKVRREELRRERASRSTRSRTTGAVANSPAWMAAGLVGFYVAFALASTVLVSSDGADRWVVGLVPFLAAILWTEFSGVRRLQGTVVERWLIPTGRHMFWTAFGIFWVCALVMPERAASRMSNDGAWFVSEISQESALHFIVGLTEAVGDLLAAAFSFASSILPW